MITISVTKWPSGSSADPRFLLQTSQRCSQGTPGEAEVNQPFPDSPHVKGIQQWILGYDTNNPYNKVSK